jgi:hypothetical protein
METEHMHTAWKFFMIATGVALTVGGVGTASAQTGFEGVTTFVMHRDDGRADTSLQTSKGNKIRLEGLGGSGFAMIFNGDDHSRTTMMAEKKMYMRTTQEQEEAQMAQYKSNMAKADTEGPANFKIATTGRTETVAGVSCQVYHGSGQLHDKPQEVDVCVANGVGFAMFTMMGQSMSRSANPRVAQTYQAMKEMLAGNRGIVKVTEIKDGKPVVWVEMIKVERKPIPDVAFVPPPDYTEFKMPQMGGMKKP